ncbi:lysophospholipid acyltransferase 1-like isoform X1 [Dendronephthya gigantea]|uniref:lysophospholipid acyltransferase 1-like isoform X1 n=1 Tax=Dendronephthya gigantea TaxID=151771 RepID=UPI00106C69A6|nr:lysophospholipid acyltransferase 1-like isoform X1 [Dendronephthya gigantea]
MGFTEKLFDDLARSSGIPADQISVIVGMLVTLFLSILYNLFLSPLKVGRTTRLAFGVVWGIAIGWFCYTSDMIQLVILLLLSYYIIQTVSPQVVHRYIFTLAMSWLSINHIYRQVTDYGGYKLDITGPLMLITQRLTYVGFAVHDGLGRDPKELTHEQRQHSIKYFYVPIEIMHLNIVTKIIVKSILYLKSQLFSSVNLGNTSFCRKRPSFLEFFSYILHFSMLLVGPSCSYYEFMEFVDGTNMKGFKQSGKAYLPMVTATKKILLSYVFLGGLVLGNALISPKTCIDPEFMSKSSLLTKIIFSYIVIAAIKMRYYYAWTFADGVINVAGMGYNGLDENGEAQWDKFTNAKIKQIELGTNSRTILKNWNIGTEKWLKRIIYDRSNDNLTGVLATSVTSAFWHGFYPGYYLCFVTVGFLTLSSRLARRSFRPYFQESKEKQIFYDILTWLITCSMVVYSCIPFVLLDLNSGFIFWRSLYFYGHIVVLLGFASPWISAALGMKREEKNIKLNGPREMTEEPINSRRIDGGLKQE